MRLIKDTLKYLNKGFKRSLSKRGVVNKDTGQSPRYRIQIPKDKLDLLVGITLENRYYVLSLLGKGGMSLVYKAKDLQSGQVVAVKCLRTQVLGDENIVKRFKREADVLDRLNHPRIVQFYGYGTNQRGQPYFVMDYLIGTSLGEILRKQGRLDLGRFQDVFVQVAAAIGHAHKHGAVHRDIKPGNIMLVEKGGTSDYVKIVDFGIAKVTEGAQKLTRLGEVWGSPIYMSPEQCVGTNIDTRTDIYSLGVVMYEALTGEVPFLGRNYAETMMKQMTDEPPSFAQANPKVKIPEELEKIVFRAIAKKPEDRYQTMQELKHDLEWALNKSLGTLPKQQEPMLSVSGKQMTTEETIPPSSKSANPKVTADRLEKPKFEKKPTVDMQQKVTAEDMPKFNPNDRLNKAKPRNEAPEPKSMDFEPPQDRLKFELTGPQVIAASTTDDTNKTNASPKISRQRMQSRSSDNLRKDGTSADGGKRGTSGSRTPRKRTTSRNRLAAQVPEPYDTIRGGKPKEKNNLKQIVLAIFILMMALGLGYASRDYFATLAKEVLYFESEKHQSASEHEKSTSEGTTETTPQHVIDPGSKEAQPNSTDPY